VVFFGVASEVADHLVAQYVGERVCYGLGMFMVILTIMRFL
jgi:hypothetical protein